jgi:hypothetical protein
MNVGGVSIKPCVCLCVFVLLYRVSSRLTHSNIFIILFFSKQTIVTATATANHQQKDKLGNLRLVQRTLIAHKVKKEIPVARLAKCKFADNHEMLAWCYDYVHRTYPDSNYNYRAREARERAMVAARGGGGGGGGGGGRGGGRGGNSSGRRRGRNSGRQRAGGSNNSPGRRGSPGRDGVGLSIDTNNSPSVSSLSPGNSNLLPSNHLNNSLRPGLTRSPPQDAILGPGAGSPPMLDLGNFSGREISSSSSSSSFPSSSGGGDRGHSGRGDYGGRDDPALGRSSGDGGIGNRNGNNNLRESRIPVSKTFFSNMYGGSGGGDDDPEGIDGSFSAGLRAASISDSSLYAGLAKYNLEEANANPDGDHEREPELEPEPEPEPEEDKLARSNSKSAKIQAELLSKIPTSGSPGGFLDRLDAAVREASPTRAKTSANDQRRQAEEEDDSSPSSRRRARDFVMQQHSKHAQRAQQRAIAASGDTAAAAANKRRLQERIAELESALTTDMLSQRSLEDAVENVRVERDFYYDTLRAIEGALRRRIIAQPELGATATANDLLGILEATP